MVPALCIALLVVLGLHLDATVAECECGKKNVDHPIVGGNESQVREWPWQVYLIDTINVIFCSGSLISPSWILTAAHCVKPAEDFIKENSYINIKIQDVLMVTIGNYAVNSINDTSYTQDLSVRKIKIHSNYYERGFNDIAVIQLSHPVEYSYGFRPVCLPTKLRTQMFVGENATIAVWGRTSSNDLDTSNVVRDLTFPVISNTECFKKFTGAPSNSRWPNVMICTYDEGRNVCIGHSGGALVWLDDSGRYQQIGIATTVKKDKRNPCTGKNYPGVYTRVTSYIHWIEEETKERFCSP